MLFWQGGYFAIWAENSPQALQAASLGHIYLHTLHHSFKKCESPCLCFQEGKFYRGHQSLPLCVTFGILVQCHCITTPGPVLWICLGDYSRTALSLSRIMSCRGQSLVSKRHLKVPTTNNCSSDVKVQMLTAET